MRRTASATCLILVLLAACSGHGASHPAAAASTAPAGPTTTIDPAVATEAQETAAVNDILAGLDGVMGDLQRILVRQRAITTDVTDRLRAIYAGPELLNQIDAFKADLAGGLLGYKNPPGNRITTVTRLITASPICIFVQVKRDYSPLTIGVSSANPSTLYVALANKDAADDPKHLNPTPWTMLYDGVQSDGSQPEDICR